MAKSKMVWTWAYRRKTFSASVRNAGEKVSDHAEDLINGIKQVDKLVAAYLVEDDSVSVWLKRNKRPPLAELAVLGALAGNTRPDETSIDKRNHMVFLWWD